MVRSHHEGLANTRHGQGVSAQENRLTALAPSSPPPKVMQTHHRRSSSTCPRYALHVAGEKNIHVPVQISFTCIHMDNLTLGALSPRS